MSSTSSAVPSKTSTSSLRRRGEKDKSGRQNDKDKSTKRNGKENSIIPNPSAESDPAAKSPATKKPVVPPSSQSTPLTVALNSTDYAIMLSLLIAAIAVRAFRLTKISSVIFDEVHYFNFTNYILRREYFFDVNPVFGKLIIAFIANLFGYDGTVKNVELGQKIAAHQAFAGRISSVIFGSLTIPVFYRVCRLLHLSIPGSVLGSLFILLDCMHIIQSRIIMVDSALVFFSCLSLLFALYLWNAKNVVVIKRGSVTVRDAASVAIFLVFTGICCGLAVSVRWTAFAAPLLIFTISMFGVGPFCLEPLNELELLVLYGSAFLAYCGSFAVFLWHVNQTGPGDNFMSEEFQRCIHGSAKWIGERGCTMSMWRRIWELNATIFRYSKGIRGNDKWGSSWFQWIANWRGALYYRTTQEEEGTLSMIYLLMNPMMATSIDSFMLVYVGALFMTVRYRKTYAIPEALKEHLRRGAVMFFGWIASMLPTMVVYRSGPVYQYLPGLFFAQALASVGFDIIPPFARPAMSLALAIILVAAFIYWSPWVYAIPLPHARHVQRQWFPKWD